MNYKFLGAALIAAVTQSCTLSCPSHEQVSQLFSRYSLENVIAEFELPSKKLEIPYKNRVLRVWTDYFFRAYGPDKSEKRGRLKGRKEIEQFLEEKPFSFIELYEMDETHKVFDRPSVVIYNIGITYVVFQVERETENFYSNQCIKGWSPDLVTDIGKNILTMRLLDANKKHRSKQIPFQEPNGGI